MLMLCIPRTDVETAVFGCNNVLAFRINLNTISRINTIHVCGGSITPHFQHVSIKIAFYVFEIESIFGMLTSVGHFQHVYRWIQF